MRWQRLVPEVMKQPGAALLPATAGAGNVHVHARDHARTWEFLPHRRDVDLARASGNDVST